MDDVEQSVAADTRKEVKVIKRYSNRKLYDTEQSRYVTLEDISEMIKSGAEVRIVDNRTKEDLTSVTLAQIVFEEEKKSKMPLPLGILRSIIRHGEETVTDFLQNQAGHVGQRIIGMKEEAEGFLALSQRLFEDWQKRIDERVRHAVENLTNLPNLVKEIAAIEKRVSELERELDVIEKDKQGEEK